MRPFPAPEREYKTMQILLVDDHILIRKGLIRLLESEGFEFGEAGDGPQAFQEIAERNYDVVLLDISLPGQNGLDVLKRLKQERPLLPVLMLTMYPNEQYAVRAIACGASGYIMKDSPPKILVEAIRTVAMGRRYLTPTVQELLANEMEKGSSRGSSRHQRLSDREFQVASMVASGKTVGQIAEEIHLSVNTISTYRSRILTKLGMKTNAELTAYMVRKGFFT